MRTSLTILCVMVIATVAWADKPVQSVDNPVDRVECAFENVTYDWDFNESDWGFTTGPCDDGGVPTWEYGIKPPEGFPVWGTTLEGNYPNDAGESLISPSFNVDILTYLVEVWHTYEIEPGYDGGNVSVNGVVVEPMEGYPNYELYDYAWCVDGEPGFTEYGLNVYSCFDLSAFMGEEVQLSFNFGSDSSVQYWGWAIRYVRVGTDETIANDGTTWTAVKGLYR